MVRAPSFDINGIKSGVWSKEEDDTLRAFVHKHGHRNWQKLPFLAGLERSGKSCRLRWMNYLQPGLKKGKFSKQEEDLIITLHNQLGNRWSAIAEKLPGRTDNDIKNQWHAHIKKRAKRSRAKMIEDEEQSFEINCYKESICDQKETAAFNDAVFPQGDPWTEAAYDHSFFSTEEASDSFAQFPPLIPGANAFPTFGPCNNHTPAFSYSSDGGITYDNYTCFNDLDISTLVSEEEFSDLGLCYNDTPTFSNSSDGGITYDNYTCFNDLDISTLVSEEEFSDLGLRYNDTPTFSDSTCFTQLNNIDILPQFPEEDSSVFGLFQNGAPTFSDSSNGERELLGFDHLERAWYFGDDQLYMN